jgi:hypothetical protein
MNALPAADTAVSLASPRDLAVHLVGRALISEAAVHMRKAEKKSTSYYAGRRAGFVSAAAATLHQLFGVDFEAAKHAVSQGVQLAGEGWTPADLRDPDKNGPIATTIVDAALDV